MSEQLSVSVLIRNRNEAATLRHVFAALAKQTRPHELVFVDNRSTDESRALAQEAGAVIIDLAEFTYGRALNIGFEHATGDIVVVLSAHSIPLSRDFIALAVEPFEASSRLAAVRCVNVHHRADALSWFDDYVLEGDLTIDEVGRRGPSNSGCAIRRCVWEGLRFDESLPFAEDKKWAWEAIRAGWVAGRSPAPYLYVRDLTWRQALHQKRRKYEARAQLLDDWARPPLLPYVRRAGAGAAREVAVSLGEWWVRLQISKRR